MHSGRGLLPSGTSLLQLIHSATTECERLKPSFAQGCGGPARRRRRCVREIAGLVALVSLAGIPGCTSHGANKSTFVVANGSAGDLSNVIVLADPTFTAPTLDDALDQLGNPKSAVIGTLPKPAISALQALAGVQKLARRPVVAVTEYRNWLWFATNVTLDEQAKAVTAFTGGCAVQKGGNKVMKWGAQ
jgi:hypothetical protein